MKVAESEEIKFGSARHSHSPDSFVALSKARMLRLTQPGLDLSINMEILKFHHRSLFDPWSQTY